MSCGVALPRGCLFARGWTALEVPGLQSLLLPTSSTASHKASHMAAGNAASCLVAKSPLWKPQGDDRNTPGTTWPARGRLYGTRGNASAFSFGFRKRTPSKDHNHEPVGFSTDGFPPQKKGCYAPGCTFHTEERRGHGQRGWRGI